MENTVKIITDNRSEEDIIAELRAARKKHPLKASDFTAAELDKLKSVAPMEVEVMEELKRAEEFIAQHPVLKFSPSDLKHMNTSLATHLHPYSLIDQELYREYYDV